MPVSCFQLYGRKSVTMALLVYEVFQNFKLRSPSLVYPRLKLPDAKATIMMKELNRKEKQRHGQSQGKHDGKMAAGHILPGGNEE
jgi:hypothetical protein